MDTGSIGTLPEPAARAADESPDGQALFTHTPIKPWWLATILALSYVIMAAVYIWVSGQLVERIAADVQHAQRIETLKGWGFVAVTGLGLLGFSVFLFGRIARNEKTIIEQREVLLQMERRASAGVFASSVAHDINNILSVMNIDIEEYAEKVRQEPSTEETRRVSELADAVSSITRLSRALMSLGRESTPGRLQRVELAGFLRDTLAFAGKHQRVRRCELTSELADVGPVEVNATMIRQAVFNLVLNASDAAGEKGRVLVRLASSEAGDLVFIEIHDSGPGLDPAEYSRIFRAFYSTKSGGTGLGLISVKACAETHGGNVRIARSHLGGTCFKLELPLRRAVESAA